MVVHSEVMIRNKAIGKMNTSAAAGVGFVVVLAVTEKAACGVVAAAALRGVGAGEGDELGDEEAG